MFFFLLKTSEFWFPTSVFFSAILSTDELEDEPVALKKAKSAYKSCRDPAGEVDGERIPEASIIHDQGGFPLVEESSSEFEVKYNWNDIADAISKYGIPMIFGIRVYPDILIPTKNLLYVNIIFLVIVFILNKCLWMGFYVQHVDLCFV